MKDNYAVYKVIAENMINKHCWDFREILYENVRHVETGNYSNCVETEHGKCKWGREGS